VGVIIPGRKKKKKKKIPYLTTSRTGKRGKLGTPRDQGPRTETVQGRVRRGPKVTENDQIGDPQFGRSCPSITPGWKGRDKKRPSLTPCLNSKWWEWGDGVEKAACCHPAPGKYQKKGVYEGGGGGRRFPKTQS